MRIARLTVGVAHDETVRRYFGGLGQREAAQYFLCFRLIDHLIDHLSRRFDHLAEGRTPSFLMAIQEVRTLLSVCDSLGESAHVRLAHPVPDFHRLSSHYCGVAGNDGT